MKTKLALGLMGSLGMSAERQIELFRHVGFDGFFYGWNGRTDVASIVRCAEKHGMEIGSAHAPFLHCDKLWEETDETETAVFKLISCVRSCAEYGIPVMVSHVMIGFDKHNPTEAGLHNFESIVNEAEKLGVKIAFENTEGEEYLAAVMEHFKDCGAACFCLDTGHEICYNLGRDMVDMYGNRLIYTHINDNLGVCGNEITYLDDLHLLPFDGVCDFDGVAKRLGECGYNGTLTLELTTQSKPGRHENDKYAEMTAEDYLTEAYMRAERVAKLVEWHREKISCEKLQK